MMQFVGMKNILRSCFVVFCCLIFYLKTLHAQTENADALPKQFDLHEQESVFWMPNLLQSNYSGLHEMAQYQGFALNWAPRGVVQSKGNHINGLNWFSNLSGWDPSFTYAGLYGGLKTQHTISAYGISAFGLGGQAGNSFSTTNAIHFTKTKAISAKLSNASTMHEIRMQWHSGAIKQSNWINLEGVYQKTPGGYLANGMKDRKGLLLSIEKNISEKHQMGFSFWWSPVTQGKRAPTVQEMFMLTKDPLYNPSWGWRNGQAFYANTKKSNAPVMSMHYDYKTSKGNSIEINLGGVFGTQSATQLDWSKAADPRPDYYKYLPSFAIDEQLKNKLLNRYEVHPEFLQIQFDQLIAKNSSNTNGAAQYIINERIQKLQLLRTSLRTNFALSANSYWYTGLAFNTDKIGYNNRVADLLGGQFYYNYNTWVNDDGLATAFQNDLLAPDRKIKAGETWGAHYNLYSKNIQAWTSLIGSTRFMEWGLGAQMGFDQMQRKGINQNGLFPQLSKGVVIAPVFPSYQYQFFLRYKLNGRWYLTTHFFQQWEAPSAADFYSDASNHAIQNPFILPLIHSGVEVKLQFMGSNIKGNAAFFLQSNQNEREYKMFYHDYYNAFVRASAGQIETLHRGIETFVETNWSSPIQLSLANSYGLYLITNLPLYELRLSDNLYKVQSGLLFLKQFPATSYPQAVQAITINYQPVYSLRFSCSILYSSRRAISHDVFRRSSWTKENTSTQDAWEKLRAPVFAPNQWVSNIFISKSFQVKATHENYSLRLTASIRNFLNASIPSLIFEQSRYDYKNFEAAKFPSQYIYDLGRTYTIGLQLTVL